jgi:hypothetical protein
MLRAAHRFRRFGTRFRLMPLQSDKVSGARGSSRATCIRRSSAFMLHWPPIDDGADMSKNAKLALLTIAFAFGLALAVVNIVSKIKFLTMLGE